MALIVGLPIQAIDQNGDVMPFAELHTFDADATTTPKVTYSDPDMTVQHPNPVPAGDDGYFPPMYATEGEIFYVAMTPQDGDPDLPFKAYPHVPAIGGDESAVFLKTFADGRYEITSGEVEPGSDGILIRAGRPAPQNTGGYIKESGWNGTQLDKKIIDAAELEVTGNLTVGGSISSDAIDNAVPIAIEKQTISNVASVDIALPAGYGDYELRIRNFITVSTSAVQLHARLSFDDGATYKSASTDYQSQGIAHAGASVSVTAAANGTDMILTVVGNNMGTSSGGVDMVVELFTGAARETRTITRVTGFVAGNNLLSTTGLSSSTTNNKAYGRATHIRLFAVQAVGGAATNMSCEYVLIGKP